MKNPQTLAAELLKTALLLGHTMRTAGMALPKGLLPMHIGVMHLLKQGVNSQNELVQALELSPPTVSAMVESLVKRGILQRIRCAQDRRKVDLQLTADGGKLLEEMEQRIFGYFVQHIENAHLSPDQENNLYGGILLIQQIFRKNSYQTRFNAMPHPYKEDTE